MSQSPTFVLVHGALFTSQGWFLLESQLQNVGQSVVTVDLPGRASDGINPKEIDLNTAVSKLCQVIQSVSGPVILVGHSQGGAVITQALEKCAQNVKSLVYVAAVVPLSGETAFDALDPKHDVNFAKCVTPEPESRLFRLNRKGPLESSFLADVRPLDSDLADSAVAGMVSEPMGIGTTPLRYDEERFAKIPKYYVETIQDQVVSIETQRKYQARTAFTKVYSLESSHSPFLSRPKELATILLEVLSINASAQKSEEKTQSKNPNIKIVTQYFESLKTGNMELLASLLDDGIIWHQPGNGKLSGTYNGKQAVFGLFGKFMEISKGSFRIDSVKNIMANGDLVTATLHFSANKSGSSISMDGVDLMRIENTKIKEVFLFSSDQEAEDKFWE